MNNSMNGFGGEIIVYIFAGVVVGVFLLMAYLAFVLIPFLRDIKYMKIEYKRSRGAEKKKWKRRIKKAYLNLIPGLGNLLIR